MEIIRAAGQSQSNRSGGYAMPIQIPNDLPAAETLKKENIFVMTQTRAETQQIRPPGDCAAESDAHEDRH